MPMSGKKPAYISMLSTYFIDVTLKLLCAKFALHWKNIKIISWKKNSGSFTLPNLFNPNKASIYRVQFPNSLICLKLIWVNKQ